jgi:hypothetical protein
VINPNVQASESGSKFSGTACSSLDLTRMEAAQRNGNGNNARLDSALQLAARARTDLGVMTGIQLLEIAGMDPLRVAVKTTGLGLSGFKADELLRVEFGVNAAFSWQTGLVFVLGLGSKEEHVNRLVGAFTLLSDAANGGPPLLHRSEILRDLDVIEEECSRQLQEALTSWKDQLSTFVEHFEEKLGEFFALDQSAQRKIGGRIEQERERGENQTGASSDLEGRGGDGFKVTLDSEGALLRELETIQTEGREEIRSCADRASSSLDKAADVSRKDARDALVSYRNGLSQKFEDPRMILSSAGALLAGVAERKGKLPVGAELQGLKRILCEKQIKAARLLEEWYRGKGRAAEDGVNGVETERKRAETECMGAETEGKGVEAERKHADEAGACPRDPFELTDEERASTRSRDNSRRSSRQEFGAAFFSEPQTQGLDVTFERAKRGYLEAASLVREAQQLMVYGSGKVQCEGPFTGQQKEALARNQTVAAALEYASEDLVLIRCFGGRPSNRPRKPLPEATLGRPLEDALKLELRKASRVGRSAQVQLQEVLEGLEHASVPEEGLAAAEAKTALRNESVLFHVQSALGHLRRAFGDQVTDWEADRVRNSNMMILDERRVAGEIADHQWGEPQQLGEQMTPREAFFADIERVRRPNGSRSRERVLGLLPSFLRGTLAAILRECTRIWQLPAVDLPYSLMATGCCTLVPLYCSSFLVRPHHLHWRDGVSSIGILSAGRP